MELKLILECLLFSSQQPLSPKELRDLLTAAADQDEAARPFKKLKIEDLTATLEQLAVEHDQSGRSFRLACVAGCWQFCTRPDYSPWLKALVGEKNRPGRLSQPALETLAIIAYRQPITRAEIEQVRGVAVDGVMQTLLERGLVTQAGRAEVIGRPMTYATTVAFLEYFGLRSLDDMPAADELRRIPIVKPEALLTVDPGLATAPPDALESSTEAATETSPAPPAVPAEPPTETIAAPPASTAETPLTPELPPA